MAQEQLNFKPHSWQQDKALRSNKPITLLATGIQFGKTIVGALWMKRHMHKHARKGTNFIITSPTYKILSQSTLPPFLRFMDGFGTYHRQDAVFELDGGGLCYFRTGTDPDSIVGITDVHAIYGDEAGLYSLYFWENIQARAAFKAAPILLTTSPYSLNWVYKDLIRPKIKDKDARPDVEYIKARSIDNPLFPKDYYERMRLTMDERRFRAMFGGDWEKMDGLVYDIFDEDECSVTPFALPIGTQFYAGVDWGTTAPFALVVIAITPEGNYYQVTELFKQGLTILDMVQATKQLLLKYPIKIFYADPSEPGYIEEFNRAGIATVAANNDVKLGISLVYELIKSKRFKLFRGDNKYTIDEFETYHYPSPDEEITADKDVKDRKPVKQTDHAMDALRYCIAATFKGLHRKEPQVINYLDDGKKLDIYERMRRIRTPSSSGNFESW